MNKQMYCKICDETTQHQPIGTQRGVPGKHLDLYDCLQCKDTCGRWEDDEQPINLEYFNGSRMVGLSIERGHPRVMRFEEKYLMAGVDWRKKLTKNRNEEPEIKNIGSMVVNLNEI